jgi:hypothetical protein
MLVRIFIVKDEGRDDDETELDCICKIAGVHVV